MAWTSNDLRPYHVCSDRLLSAGFVPKRNTAAAVREAMTATGATDETSRSRWHGKSYGITIPCSGRSAATWNHLTVPDAAESILRSVLLRMTRTPMNGWLLRMKASLCSRSIPPIIWGRTRQIAFSLGAHMTEESELIWTYFLQGVFPNSSFIIIIRPGRCFLVAAPAIPNLSEGLNPQVGSVRKGLNWPSICTVLTSIRTGIVCNHTLARSHKEKLVLTIPLRQPACNVFHSLDIIKASRTPRSGV